MTPSLNGKFSTIAVVLTTVGILTAGLQWPVKFECLDRCSTDEPNSVIKSSVTGCTLACIGQPGCRDFNFDDATKDCSIYLHKPLFYAETPNCIGYRIEDYNECPASGTTALPTIPAHCCAFPFTLNGSLYYSCTDDVGGVGCYHGDREWKLCQQPAVEAMYVETSTTVLSADPAVSVPLLTINGWLLMQRKATGGSVSFNQNWAEYRDGFGSPNSNDNYWLGLDKVYRLTQMGNVRLRVEIQRTSGLWYSAEYSTFSISDEAGNYQLTVNGYSGDAGNALMTTKYDNWKANGRMFSARDRDNDIHPHTNCAGQLGGWWYGKCTTSVVNMPVGAVWTTGVPVYDVQASCMFVMLN